MGIGPSSSIVEPVGPCWYWGGHDWFKHGYGRCGFGSRVAHREVYIGLVGPIPNGYEIDHLCHNRACVNPDHLEAVTPQENKRRTPGLCRKCSLPLTVIDTMKDGRKHRGCKPCRNQYQRERARRIPCAI